mgnify:CR=1 FL=1
MKSIRRLFMFLCCATLLCAACAPSALASEAPLSIVCTIFPAYDFARQLAGYPAQVRLLLPPGSESHSYEPSPRDIIDIQQAFLYAGGESDHWVEEILASMGENAPRTFRLTDCVTLLAEETSASMEQEAHEHGQEEAEMDEHVWTSPKNAMLIVQQLCATLCDIAPQNTQAYEGALSTYLADLKELDAAFEETVANGKRDLIVFGDRFPFRYLVDDYGLTYYAAFVGCSAETEASFETIAFLAKKVDELKLPVVLTIEGDNHSIAETVVSSTQAKKQAILTMNSIQSVTAADVENGENYLDIMAENLNVLKEALN